MATTAEITTAEQLFEAPDLGPCELVRGELIMVSPPGYVHGSIEARLARALGNFVEANGLGDVLAGEPGFIIARDPDTVRAPDVAFVRAERIPAGERTRFFEGAPDLAVEVLSPNDRASEVNAKVQDWLDAGCQAAGRFGWLTRRRRRFRSTAAARRSRSSARLKRFLGAAFCPASPSPLLASSRGSHSLALQACLDLRGRAQLSEDGLEPSADEGVPDNVPGAEEGEVAALALRHLEDVPAERALDGPGELARLQCPRCCDERLLQSLHATSAPGASP